MIIRPLLRTDLPRVIAMLESANLGGASANLARYLAWQPDCGWVIDEQGEVIGSVTVLQQGTVGFVGAMAVAPAHQGQGLGRSLLEHAQTDARRVGITSFLLEATEAGEPLYTSLGYLTIGETVIAQRTATGPAPAVRVTDRERAIAIDREATLLERADMVSGLLAEDVPSTIRERGYGIAPGLRLGPVLAADEATGQAIVEALVAATTVVGVPMENTIAMRAMEAHGFTTARTLKRMALDLPAPPSRDQIWALASPGAG